MSDMHDLDYFQKKSPDYFKALKMPWHLAASFLAEFVDDEEKPLGLPTHHARILFLIAQVLEASLAAEKERADKAEKWNQTQKQKQACLRVKRETLERFERERNENKIRAEKAEDRVHQLEAACVLGDAGMAIAEKGLIHENEIIAPYLEMKSRAEAAEERADEAIELLGHCAFNHSEKRLDGSQGAVAARSLILDFLASLHGYFNTNSVYKRLETAEEQTRNVEDICGHLEENIAALTEKLGVAERALQESYKDLEAIHEYIQDGHEASAGAQTRSALVKLEKLFSIMRSPSSVADPANEKEKL